MTGLRLFLLGVMQRFYRALILLFTFLFIELDMRKVVTLSMPRDIGQRGIDAVLDVLRDYFEAQFVLLPFYLVIIAFPWAERMMERVRRNRLWLIPIGTVLVFSYFITLEANIGVFLYWFRPGYEEVAFSMTLMPLILLTFLTLDARRIIGALRSKE